MSLCLLCLQCSHTYMGCLLEGAHGVARAFEELCFFGFEERSTKALHAVPDAATALTRPRDLPDHRAHPAHAVEPEHASKHASMHAPHRCRAAKRGSTCLQHPKCPNHQQMQRSRQNRGALQAGTGAADSNADGENSISRLHISARLRE